MSRVIKNTTYLTGAYIFQKILAFIYFTLIARLVGVESTGIYTFAFGYTTIFSVFVDFGLTHVLIRETAKDTTHANSILNRIIGIKLILAVITYFVVITTITIVEPVPLNRWMVYLAGILMVTDSFTLVFWGVFRGFQNLGYEALSVIITQFITVVVGVTGLLMKWPLTILVIAFICGGTFNLLFSLYLIKKKLKFKIRPIFSWIETKKLLALSIPFALLGIFTRLWMSIDTVLLKFMVGETFVGLYSVPFKINVAFQFIPNAFAAAIYPAMSRYYVTSKDSLKNLFEKSIRMLMIVSIPASVGIIVLSDVIIRKIYGVEYEKSILAMQILTVSLLFVFLGFPVGALLNACDRQMRNTKNVGIVLIFALISNLIFIPYWQHYASSLIAVLSNALMVILGLYYCREVIKYSMKYLLIEFTKILCSALFMGLIVYTLKTSVQLSVYQTAFELMILPLVGALVYIVSLALFGGIHRGDLKEILKGVKK